MIHRFGMERRCTATKYTKKLSTWWYNLPCRRGGPVAAKTEHRLAVPPAAFRRVTNQGNTVAQTNLHRNRFSKSVGDVDVWLSICSGSMKNE